MALIKSDIILLIFVCISIPVYVIFLLTLIVNRKKEPFNSHFFLLSISLGCADLAAVIHAYLFIRVPGWGWFVAFYIDNGPAGSFLAFYALAMQFALTCSQHLGVLLIGINRFTRFGLQNNNYNRLWSGKNFLCAIFLQWFLPVILFGSMAPQTFHYWEYVDNVTEGYANIDFSDETVQTIYYALAFCVNFVVDVVTVIVYAVILTISVKQAVKRTKTVGNNWAENTHSEHRASNAQKKALRSLNYAREMKLAVSGFALCVAMLGYFVFLLLIGVANRFDLAYLWNIASDLFCCIQPYTVLLMSKETRKQFFKLVRCWSDLRGKRNSKFPHYS